MSLQTPTPTSEQYLKLSDGRTLAYTESGNSSSSILVIFLHGMFGIGSAPTTSGVLLEKGVHYISPTLPGWGASSPRNNDRPYSVGIASDITALIDHLHPHDLNLKIYIAGGSYGTVPAQMLYGAPFDVFPYGRYLAGCMLLAPLSPPRFHTDYAKALTMGNYIAIGPPSRYIPFKLVPRLVAFVIHQKVKTLEGAERFIRSLLFDQMKEEESIAFKKYKEDNSKADGEVEREFAENTMKSVQYTWEGCMETGDVIHGDWGFHPAELDEEHNKRPILVVTTDGDTTAPAANAKWLVASYKNSHYRLISGGHLGSMYHMNDLWRQLLEL
ncbi:alpha/beta-hydrolase [Phlegmacium glaucopus]|nr:alpha/beta-hydrolase [Phlegmacium glaucopus]